MPARGCTRDTSADRLAPHQWVQSQAGKGTYPTGYCRSPAHRSGCSPAEEATEAWFRRLALPGRLANLCRLLVAEVHIRPGRLGCQSSTCYGSNCESPGPNESPKPHGLHSSRLERSKMSAYSVPIEKLALTGSFRASDRLRGKPYVERMGREISIPRSPLRALG